jgi:hypothetical protein
VNDLDVETRQARACLGCADLALWCGFLKSDKHRLHRFAPSLARYRHAAARASSVMAAEIFSAIWY